MSAILPAPGIIMRLDVAQVQAVPLLQRIDQGVVVADLLGHLADDVDVVGVPRQISRQNQGDGAGNIDPVGSAQATSKVFQKLTHFVRVGLVHEAPLNGRETNLIERFAAYFANSLALARRNQPSFHLGITPICLERLNAVANEQARSIIKLLFACLLADGIGQIARVDLRRLRTRVQRSSV